MNHWSSYVMGNPVTQYSTFIIWKLPLQKFFHDWKCQNTKYFVFFFSMKTQTSTLCETPLPPPPSQLQRVSILTIFLEYFIGWLICSFMIVMQSLGIISGLYQNVPNNYCRGLCWSLQKQCNPQLRHLGAFWIAIWCESD